MKPKFEERESFKHKLAKELLAKWFKDAETGNDFCELAQFKWRKNYGVFTELKFYDKSDPYYFELSKGLDPRRRRFKDPAMWFSDEDKGKILFVPDITIFHKGTPKYLIEVVNTNSVSGAKFNAIAKFFNGHYVEIHQISADEILRHTAIPKYINSHIVTL